MKFPDGVLKNSLPNCLHCCAKSSTFRDGCNCVRITSQMCSEFPKIQANSGWNSKSDFPKISILNVMSTKLIIILSCLLETGRPFEVDPMQYHFWFWGQIPKKWILETYENEQMLVCAMKCQRKADCMGLALGLLREKHARRCYLLSDVAQEQCDQDYECAEGDVQVYAKGNPAITTTEDVSTSVVTSTTTEAITSSSTSTTGAKTSSSTELPKTTTTTQEPTTAATTTPTKSPTTSSISESTTTSAVTTTTLQQEPTTTSTQEPTTTTAVKETTTTEPTTETPTEKTTTTTSTEIPPSTTTSPTTTTEVQTTTKEIPVTTEEPDTTSETTTTEDATTQTTTTEVPEATTEATTTEATTTQKTTTVVPETTTEATTTEATTTQTTTTEVPETTTGVPEESDVECVSPTDIGCKNPRTQMIVTGFKSSLPLFSDASLSVTCTNFNYKNILKVKPSVRKYEPFSGRFVCKPTELMTGIEMCFEGTVKYIAPYCTGLEEGYRLDLDNIESVSSTSENAAEVLCPDNTFMITMMLKEDKDNNIRVFLDCAPVLIE